MRVRHILKNGEMIESINNHVVRMSEVPNAYALITKMNKKGEK